jgi:hypothetical protein
MSLAGHQLPSGSARLEPYQNRLLHDAFYSPPRPEPHPVAAFVLANRGIGIALGDLFRLFGSDINDGPLLAESSIELHRPLAEDADYEVRGVVESVERRRSRRIGPLRPDYLPLRPVPGRRPGRHRDQRVRRASPR